MEKVEPEAILEKIAVRKGMVVDNYLIRADIERIYEMRHFSSVEVHHRMRQGKNQLVFRVRERPIIHSIEIVGNDEISTPEIEQQLQTKEFNILDINMLKNDVAALQKFYEEKGFFLAAVKFSTQQSQGQLKVRFSIEEFDKVRVKRITLLGNEKFSDQRLKSLMATREESLFSGLSGSGNFKEFDFKTDLERIKYFYKTQGYLQVNIGSPMVTVTGDKKWIFITLQIVEGPVFYINEIFFNGELLFTPEELQEKLLLSQGGRYAEDKLRTDIQTLTELYQNRGYAFANVLRNIEPVPGENKIDLHFSFEQGHITHFGKIVITGNTKTRDKVIRRELKIHEGMRYSGSLLRKSRENVERLGFFEPGSIIFNTSPGAADSRILDVEVQLKERNTGQLSAGAGYSSASKGFLQASIAQNNFRGMGQNLRFSLQYSQNVRTFELSFTEPYLLGSRWSGGIDLFNSRNESGGDQVVANRGFTLRGGHPLGEFSRIFAAYKYVDTEVSNVNDTTIDEQLENGPASIVETSLVWDSRNNRFEPSRGLYLSGSGEYAGLGFEKKWLKLQLDGRFYRKLVGDLLLRYRLTAGRLLSVENRQIPRSIKFFLGGPRNMRGYSLRDVGPQSCKPPAGGASGGGGRLGLQCYAQGGASSLYATLELEHPLAREAGLKWVMFADAGNVYEGAFHSPGEEFLRYDYGFGFRWFSPIGVLRFEFGYPIGKKTGEDSRQFFFDIGQLF